MFGNLYADYRESRTNAQVAEAWRRGEYASSAHMRTDGAQIYSYGLLIGVTIRGRKVGYNASRGGGKFYSMTTSTKHVPLLRGRAGVMLCAACWFSLQKYGDLDEQCGGTDKHFLRYGDGVNHA